MVSQPLFVLGSPRSGTTFLCFALNQHPLIRLTNERRPLTPQMPAEWDCVAMEKNAEGEAEIAMRLGYGLAAPDDP